MSTKNKLLPIDAVLPQLCRTMHQQQSLVLQAQPGAGKTTRVALALLGLLPDQSIPLPILGNKRILLLEPRRLATMNAARFMSALLGEQVGNTVGYTIRHQRCVSKNTRIEVITEGVLTRRLQRDPTLADVGLIIFDEFHERNLHSDLGLALSYDVQQGLRDDLKLLVMSATIDTAAVAKLLGGCPVISCGGRSYPIDVVYCGDSDNQVAQQVLLAVRRALAEQSGDVLVFLPGIRQIRSCQRLLTQHLQDVVVALLYGALPFEKQQQALATTAQRKVVLATNIAETSLTIDGIGAVVDSGLERRLVFNPASGMNSLVTGKISAASATQRAGRAGRLCAGICYRLWSETTQNGLLEHSVAEICRCDLTALVLELALWGLNDSQQLVWLDVPGNANFATAQQLLRQLSALNSRGQITPSGQKMIALPLHPRLAAMVLAAKSVEEQALACELAILLDEAEILPLTQQHQSTSSDLLDRLEYWHTNRISGQQTQTIANCERSLRVLLQRLKIKPTVSASLSADVIGRLLLAAFPDRVAQRRLDGGYGGGDAAGNGDQYKLRYGGGACLSSRSNVTGAQWLVAAQIEHQTGGEALIHQASTLTTEQVGEYFVGQLEWLDEAIWDKDRQRVVGRQCHKLDALILKQRPIALESHLVVPLLVKQIQHAGLASLGWNSASRRWLQRARFVAAHTACVAAGASDDWPMLDDESLLANVEDWLGGWMLGGGNGSAVVSSLAALKKIDLLEPLQGLLNWKQRQQLDKYAPVKIQVPSGSWVTIDYADDDNPVLAAKLQELFGWHSSPTIAGGAVALTIHLLSPARRPLQVTRDLANFWRNTYPEVKKEMKGRYPKHPWPDDPLVAVAQRGVKRPQKK